jgi:hypothetical protein
MTKQQPGVRLMRKHLCLVYQQQQAQSFERSHDLLGLHGAKIFEELPSL